jgi:hypothetical protein
MTSILDRTRTVQFLPGTQKAPQALQKRRFHLAGMGTLWRDDIFRAKATYLLEKEGRTSACSKSSLIRLNASFCREDSFFTPILQRIKLYKHLA